MQIISIHASKGLEFPVVIVGDLGVPSGVGRAEDLILDGDMGPVLKVQDEEGRGPLAYLVAARRESDRDEEEARRLLYVATTRVRGAC